jgi:hypothetical protein
MARQKQQGQQSMADDAIPVDMNGDLPHDVNTPAEDAASDQGIDVIADTLAKADPGIAAIEEKIHSGMIAALEGTTDELHAIQTRLAEMLPFMDGAIANADGAAKDWLLALKYSL